MKERIVILLMGAAIVFASTAVFAQHEHGGHEHEMAEEEQAEAIEGPIEAGNKICPVSGEEIKEEEAYKFEYEGKVYNFCCSMCVKDFKKDPQKYIDKLEEMEEGEEEEKGSHHHEHGEH